jgi:hypothetical protein
VTAVDSGKKAMELLGPKGQGRLDSSPADANVSTESTVLMYLFLSFSSVRIYGCKAALFSFLLHGNLDGLIKASTLGTSEIKKKILLKPFFIKHCTYSFDAQVRALMISGKWASIKREHMMS